MWANGFTAGCKRGTYLLTLYEKMGAVVAIACRIRVKPDRVRIPDICLFLAEPREQVPTTPALHLHRNPLAPGPDEPG
jgi:hypothetical protein